MSIQLKGAVGEPSVQPFLVFFLETRSIPSSKAFESVVKLRSVSLLLVKGCTYGEIEQLSRLTSLPNDGKQSNLGIGDRGEDTAYP